MQDPVIDFGRVEILTFDCYGTLIDWERGILAALREIVGDSSEDDDLLEAYAAEEAPLESGRYVPYRQILEVGLAAVCRRFGSVPDAAQVARLGECVVRWPPFPDSAEALARLARRFELGVLTNCDRDLFAASAAKLGNPFSWVITAQDVQAYKPAVGHFEAAAARVGERRSGWVHVAQSLYHDHVPAQALGIPSVWINRRQGRSGGGATPAAVATPSLETLDMATFAEIALGKDWLRR